MARPTHPTTAYLLGRENMARHADWFAVAVAVVLPWSTSLSLAFIVLWLLALLGSADVAGPRHEGKTAAGGLPVALWMLAAIGMLWATVPLAERLAGFNSFHRLLAIPLLLAQFRRSERGMRVIIGFLVSCTVLLLASWLLFLFPDLPLGRHRPDVPIIPVKNYSSQGMLFSLCIVGLVEWGLFAWQAGRRPLALALGLLALIFLANIFNVATSRTALVVVPILLLLFAFRRMSLRGTFAMLVAIVVAAAAAWPSSDYLRDRVTKFADEVRSYQPGAMSTPVGERLDFWHKSVVVVADAPVLGHGTGSIRQQLRRDESGKLAFATNPHNQTFAIAIQLGLVGVAVLFAMWIAHLWLFCGSGLPAGLGIAVVVQAVISSQFNTSLFDFTAGWTYVWGVGVLGGMVLRGSSSKPCNRVIAREERG